MSIIYTIAKKAKDEYNTVIHKAGDTVKFTTGAIIEDIKRLNKLKTEIEGQKKIDEAAAQNVVQYHPEVEKANDEEKEKAVALYIYAKSKELVAQSEAKLAEIEKQLKNYADIKKDIKDQTGVDINTITDPTPQPTEAPVGNQANEEKAPQQ